MDFEQIFDENFVNRIPIVLTHYPLLKNFTPVGYARVMSLLLSIKLNDPLHLENAINELNKMQLKDGDIYLKDAIIREMMQKLSELTSRSEDYPPANYYINRWGRFKDFPDDEL